MKKWQLDSLLREWESDRQMQKELAKSPMLKQSSLDRAFRKGKAAGLNQAIKELVKEMKALDLRSDQSDDEV
jgi:hypothetical protein